MKKLSILFISLIIISCEESRKGHAGQHISPEQDTVANSVEDTTTKSKPSQQSSCSNWLENFREFRNAVYTNDRNKAKTFIDLPIKNPHNDHNEIWHLAYEGDQLPDTKKPFTEQDFDKYFDKIFSKRFINTILKIKSEEFYKNGTVETITFEEDSNTTYRMSGTFDKTECILKLSLFSNSIIRDDDGEIQDGGELCIIYEFAVLQNGQIKLKEVWLAG